LPVFARLKKDALTTPKDVIKAMGFPVETTPEYVSDILHLLLGRPTLYSLRRYILLLSILLFLPDSISQLADCAPPKVYQRLA